MGSSAVAQTTDEPTIDERTAELVATAKAAEAAVEAEEDALVSLLEEKRRVEKSLLDLQLAKVRDLIRDGKKAEAAAAMKEYERAVAYFDLAHVSWRYFPSRIRPTTTTETFRGKDYIGVFIGSGLGVYNSLKLDQPARVRHLLHEQLLTLIKEFAEVAEGAGTYGLLVSLSIPYRNFLDDDQDVRYDTLRLYLPIAEIKRFAEYEITSQDLVDASVIIVNDNRVAVTLR